MSNALGPVVRNRLASANKAEPKPHLQQRLQQQRSSRTPLGTFTTSDDGRKAFAPSYVTGDWATAENHLTGSPRRDFRPGQRARVSAAVAELLEQKVFPFGPEDARALAGRKGVVVEDRQCSMLGMVALLLDGEPWAFMPAYLQHVPPAEGDDERQAMAHGPAFDPYREPLGLGDTIEWFDGCIGVVTYIEPERLGVTFLGGSAWFGHVTQRSSLRLLTKAAPADGRSC